MRSVIDNLQKNIKFGKKIEKWSWQVRCAKSDTGSFEATRWIVAACCCDVPSRFLHVECCWCASIRCFDVCWKNQSFYRFRVKRYIFLRDLSRLCVIFWFESFPKSLWNIFAAFKKLTKIVIPYPQHYCTSLKSLFRISWSKFEKNFCRVQKVVRKRFSSVSRIHKLCCASLKLFSEFLSVFFLNWFHDFFVCDIWRSSTLSETIFSLVWEESAKCIVKKEIVLPSVLDFQKI